MAFTIPEELHKVEANQCAPLTKEQLLTNYTDVFMDPISSVPGEIHFELDPNVSPVQCAPRNVPVALREKVKEELDRHIRAGNITPVSEPTAWISNMVTVAKPEKIRLCIDPKPLNRALLRSHYHMPTLEDVLYKLPKARVFTLVDARDAFLQCKLDDESSRLTTFWPPWGRMRWLKLPFGVSVAPEIYQHKQHKLLAGLAGIEPIADDILVVGCGDTEGMLMQLQCYNLDVVYKPGPEMYVSDTLSRATLPHQGPDTPHVRHAVFATQTEYAQLDQAQHLNVTSFRFRQIAQHTGTDDVLQELKTVILDGWPDFKEDTPLAVRDYWPFRDELNVQNDVLYRGQCIIIPKALRAELLKRIHSSHIGGEACYRRARDTLFWPSMRAEIKDFVANCSACNEYARNQQKEPMMSHEIPTRPWQTVSMDIYSYAGKEFIILVDHYSDYWEIDQLPDLSAQFARYGQPDKVISDNGPQFACEQFRKFAANWGFTRHILPPSSKIKRQGRSGC
ncbi:hypothetical protein N1851_002013 [Merluccius polli]|uniref:Gypsy retrotransposon integrase-like protein 1 n=1 Tax=Merluccius polli TaxID=89951 RepID=A0AA47NAN0_MERPO|nr:hypothetical protein N1851_002013 [Merluccius polli]